MPALQPFWMKKSTKLGEVNNMSNVEMRPQCLILRKLIPILFNARGSEIFQGFVRN